MTSDGPCSEAFVWIWLPGETEPVVAGKLTADGDQLIFNYGKSYLARDNAIALYDPELPLQAGAIPLLPGLSMPACIRDASPDAWGRRVLINKSSALKGRRPIPGNSMSWHTCWSPVRIGPGRWIFSALPPHTCRGNR